MMSRRFLASVLAVQLIFVLSAGLYYVYVAKSQTRPRAVESPATSVANTPAATVGAPAQFGFISRRGTEVILRSETSVTPIRSLPVGGDYLAANRSWDGRRLAYWMESNGTAELHVLELPDRDEIVARFPNFRPGGLVWSAIGDGLLVSLATPRQDQFSIARIVMQVELGSRHTSEVYRGTGPEGASVIPLAWRGPPEVMAAYETGPGGFNFGYTVIRAGSPSVRTDPDGSVVGIQASQDQSMVLGSWLNPRAIRVWPVDDFAHPTELKVTAPEMIQQPRWWTTPSATPTAEKRDVVYAIGTQEGATFRNNRIERWNPATGARMVVKALDPGSLSLFVVRPDGSALVTQRGSGWELTDLRSGQSTAVPIVEGEQILMSVVLR